MPAESPLGREESTRRLVAAAQELFAEHGIQAVSLRQIAQVAGVNHGLIHHYIGSRDDLIERVLSLTMDETLARVRAAPGAAAAEAAMFAGPDRGWVRLFAWALLTGNLPAGLAGRSPAVDHVVELAAASSLEHEQEVRRAIAARLEHHLAREFFGAWIDAAVGVAGAEPTIAPTE